MKQNRFFTCALQGTLTMSLVAGLILVPLSFPAVRAQAAGETFEDRLLTRVDQTDSSGIVRSHLEDANGNVYKDSSTAAPDSKSKLKKAEPLPATYDLRQYGLTTSIKDQGYSGCCWAFSAVKALESNCIKQGLIAPENADFSESHLTWFCYSPSKDTSDPLYGDGITLENSLFSFQDSMVRTGVPNTFPYDNGGSATLATFTLSKWSGLEMESMAPFDASTPQNLNAMASSMSSRENLRYESYAHMQNAISFDEYMVGEDYYYKDPNMIQEMKQSIIDNGAMSVAFYYAKKNTLTTENGTSYYQTDYSGASAIKESNHAVTIVGWDDNYSRENFAALPPGNGAWLIANSYGTEFGDEGYFWLSYYDQSICDCFTLLAEPNTNYGHIYQYDGFGWGNATYSNSNSIKAANIFTADDQSPQQIRAVSFYTLAANQQYKIQIYRGVSSKPTNGTLVAEATTTGIMEHNGYHTVPLAAPVNVKAGEKFSVVVTYIPIGSNLTYVPFEGTDAGTTNSTLKFQYGSKKGQSFLLLKLNSQSSKQWYDLSAIGYNNVCIKAFADDTDTAGSLPKVRKKITLGKGETYQLGNSYTEYTSNDTALASVSGNGKVTAKLEGSTRITLSDGDSDSQVQVTIKKAPKSVQLKPAKTKKIKAGKSLQLKAKLSSGSAGKVTFRSSRSRIASVNSSGKVKAHRPGNTVITARTYNGKTARLKLTVTR